MTIVKADRLSTYDELTLIQQLIETSRAILKRLDALDESVEEIDEAIDWPAVYRRRSAQSKGDQSHAHED